MTPWPELPALTVTPDGTLTPDSLVAVGVWVRKARDYHDALVGCPAVVEVP